MFAISALSVTAIKPNDTIQFLSHVTFGFAFGVLFLAIRRRNELADYSDLDRAENDLRDEISNIRGR
jgi:hypothetical protein